jgi:hypothetical protein
MSSGNGDWQQAADAEIAIQGLTKTFGPQTVFEVHGLGEDTASAFGVVEETVTNAASPEPRTDVVRVELGLIETSEAWKVDRVEILQNPAAAPIPSG